MLIIRRKDIFAPGDHVLVEQGTMKFYSYVIETYDDYCITALFMGGQRHKRTYDKVFHLEPGDVFPNL